MCLFPVLQTTGIRRRDELLLLNLLPLKTLVEKSILFVHSSLYLNSFTHVSFSHL